MQFFYEEQLHRMECMAQEPVLFEDILCQIIDMIGPEVCLLCCDLSYLPLVYMLHILNYYELCHTYVGSRFLLKPFYFGLENIKLLWLWKCPASEVT